jgi:mono/diheme cytochrome c family protein
LFVKIRYLFIGLIPLLIAACTADQPAQSIETPSSPTNQIEPAVIKAQPVSRWYKFEHVSLGGRIFQESCAACHGKAGEGAPDWRKFGPDGKLPAPPLNGTGHAWHHPLKMLLHVVKNGSPGGQGNMPAWKEQLSDAEILAAIAWFQSRWPDQIYAAWMKREQASKAQQKG